MSRRRLAVLSGLLLLVAAGFWWFLRASTEVGPSAPDEPATARSPIAERAHDARGSSAPQAVTAPAALSPWPNSTDVTPSSPQEAAAPGTAPSGGQAPDAGPRHALSKTGIQSAMAASLPEIGSCYAEWLKVQPTLEGTLRVRFTIDSDDGVTGVVRRVSLGDAGIGHLAMEGCVLSVLNDLQFEPPLDGPIDVTYPIVLRSGADGGGPPTAP